MQTYTAHITRSDGIAVRLDILADDLTHAHELARAHGAATYGRGFTYSVRAV